MKFRDGDCRSEKVVTSINFDKHVVYYLVLLHIVGTSFEALEHPLFLSTYNTHRNHNGCCVFYKLNIVPKVVWSTVFSLCGLGHSYGYRMDIRIMINKN